jgi:hypothetical protein
VDMDGVWCVDYPSPPCSLWLIGPSSHGLPTRSRVVSEFMIGLEKMKAKAGEVSNSARALSLGDMHRLFQQCITLGSRGDKRRGVVRYVCTSHSYVQITTDLCRRPSTSSLG